MIDAHLPDLETPGRRALRPSARRTLLGALVVTLLLGGAGACSSGPTHSGRDPANGSSGDPQRRGDASFRDGGQRSAGDADPTEECANGLDDDGDDLIDEACPCTPGERQSCWPGAPGQRGVGDCADGVQACAGEAEFAAWGPCEGAIEPSAEVPGNDDDEDCDGADGQVECAESEFGESCGDSHDDDCDGLIDCEDPDCEEECEEGGDGSVEGTCVDSESATQQGCSNGIDDDCDRMVDCDDAECADASACQSVRFEDTEALCTNGLDDDQNGRTDCEEWDCRELSVCQESTVEACSNGIDDNQDGRTDCDDLDCWDVWVCREDTDQQCTNGVDDDDNGRVDCEDWECEEVSACQGDGCACQPGSTRWCHVPGPCDWGEQTCQPDGTWGPCEETTNIPGSCTQHTLYDVQCCIDAGGCCDNQNGDYSLWDPSQPLHASVGSCDDVCM